MGRYIDVDAVIGKLRSDIAKDEAIILFDGSSENAREEAKFAKRFRQYIVRWLLSAPTIKTKKVNYFDENERVWKIGEVIVGEEPKQTEPFPRVIDEDAEEYELEEWRNDNT